MKFLALVYSKIKSIKSYVFYLYYNQISTIKPFHSNINFLTVTLFNEGDKKHS